MTEDLGSRKNTIEIATETDTKEGGIIGTGVVTTVIGTSHVTGIAHVIEIVTVIVIDDDAMKVLHVTNPHEDATTTTTDTAARNTRNRRNTNTTRTKTMKRHKRRKRMKRRRTKTSNRPNDHQSNPQHDPKNSSIAPTLPL
uniref:Uncharacterized protein n=1 Tax=Ciona savignyi TaxID=51511 RepID=H2YD55_CIOSA